MNKDRFKFRVWNKEEKKMYYDAQNTYDYMTGEPIIFAGSFGCLLDNDEEWEVEQCTGLKDKNGNLIYEGDILLCDRKDVCGDTGEEIHYKKQGVVQRLKNGKYFIGGQDWYGTDITFYNECAEIIGNIHEQAEQKD